MGYYGLVNEFKDIDDVNKGCGCVMVNILKQVISIPIYDST